MNILYILVRTDMESLGRGKSIAQGAHAANQFVWDTVVSQALDGSTVESEVLAWCHEAQHKDGRPMGFGTTITLGTTLVQMQTAVEISQALGLRASLVADPEYPMLDGQSFHSIPHVVTTAYVFGDKERCKMVLKQFDLVRNDPL